MGISLKHVNLAASDGTSLEGVLTLPDAPKPVAFFITHGIAGSFDSGVPGWFGHEAAGHAYATLSLNRRDFGPNNARTTFEDGLDDLRVGLDFLSREGFSRVFLCGHSKGTAYLHPYLYETGDRRVIAIGLFGAVHDLVVSAQETFMLGTYARNLRDALFAEAEGRGGERMQFASAFGPSIDLTARGFLSYYGPLSLARPIEVIGEVKLPTLSCWCSSDLYTPERYHLALVAAGLRAGVSVEHVVIADPNPARRAEEGHCFTDLETETMERVVEWLERQV